ncbi:sensor histidine kinase [Desulfonatronovibrio hydrogenovorans]|uniref:sensor histidine kinase n=1 Tax=Desulfonatronovibrio hydrogenovorans TaxID=53245 RepID=UPI000691E11F|nr:PAS domain-containing sensor histidine kinase [Desulfonatronovibrio hydrogenovorans]
MKRNIKGASVYSAKLRWHIIISYCLAAVISLGLIAGTIYFQYRSAITERATARLVSIVMEHKGAIENFLFELANTMRMVTLLEQYDQLKQQEVLEQVYAVLEKEYDFAFEDLGVLDLEGNHLAYVGPYDLMDKNYRESPWFQEVLEKDLVISNVFLGFRQVPHFIIAIKQTNGQETWVLRATVNAVKFASLVEYVRFGRTGFAYIVSSDGHYQTRSREGFRVMDQVSPGLLDLSMFEGVNFWKLNQEDRSFFRAKTWIKDNDWLLVVEQDVDDIYGELYPLRQNSLIIFALGGALLVLLTLLTMKILLRRVKLIDSEKQLLDEQLIQSQKLASIGQLSAGIAHEINNPLAIIGEEAGWIQDILKRDNMQDIPERDELTDSLREISQQAKRCRRITHKLLSFSRKMDSTIRDVDMNLLIDEVAALREREAKLYSIKFVRDYEKDLPIIKTDSSQLRQVFFNLINNAMDAIQKDGEICITTSKNKDDSVAVSISDTGPGIPSENLLRIFDPFFTTKEPGKGTGLGLSICHGIIEKLGGTIFVASKVGHGTTFTVRLPKNPDLALVKIKNDKI